MCMRKLKIGLDCDDVLYKCNSYVIQLENMARRAAGKEPLDIQRLTTYEPTGDDLDVRFEYFKTPAFYEYQPLMEGAVDFVNDLIDMGHDLFIISSMERKFREIRMRRIAEDFPRINPENIFIAPRKDVFAVDVMLDDAVHNLQGDRAVNAQYPILMKKPWNESCLGLMSVESYNEFLALIRRIEYSCYLNIGFKSGNIFNIKYVLDENRLYEQMDSDEESEPCKVISYDEMIKKYCAENV